MTIHNTAKTIAAIAAGIDSDITWIKDRSMIITQSMIDGVRTRGWCHFAGRRPKPVTKTPTDMDLASYLPALLARDGVVSIDGYTRLTPRVDDGARHIGDVRFGQVVELVSHRSLLSFGLRLVDASVIGNDGYTEQVGAPRTFTLLAPNGDWHAGPADLSWRQRQDEAQYNQLRGLVLSDVDTFVHRNRVQSVMSAAYLANKCLLIRLDDEIEQYKRSQRSTDMATSPVITRYLGVASEIVPSFTMQVEGFELVGQYTTDICTAAYLDNLYRWRRQVQWLTRVNEYAFYLHGVDGGYTAPWVRGPEWQNTGEGQARLQLHSDLAISYQHRLVSRQVAIKAVPLAQTQAA